ncbi:hypothetical protein LPJ54_005361, partial [Coemansia sp. RSA 1824]
MKAVLSELPEFKRLQQSVDSDRIRLLFIYLVYANGSSESDRRRLEEVPQCLTINDKRAA